MPIPGQEGICSNGIAPGDVLLSFSGGIGQPLTLSTPPAVTLGFGCGTPGAVPGPMLFPRTPGPHTYELRYADCGCETGSASFSERTLRVAGRE